MQQSAHLCKAGQPTYYFAGAHIYYMWGMGNLSKMNAKMIGNRNSPLGSALFSAPDAAGSIQSQLTSAGHDHLFARVVGCVHVLAGEVHVNFVNCHFAWLMIIYKRENLAEGNKPPGKGLESTTFMKSFWLGAQEKAQICWSKFL
jgi:hypothetical protein